MNKYFFFFLCCGLAAFSATFIYQVAFALRAVFKILMLKIEERRILKRIDSAPKQKTPDRVPPVFNDPGSGGAIWHEPDEPSIPLTIKDDL